MRSSHFPQPTSHFSHCTFPLPTSQPPPLTVRLACLIHAASVHPGPGSNPLIKVTGSKRHGTRKMRLPFLAPCFLPLAPLKDLNFRSNPRSRGSSNLATFYKNVAKRNLVRYLISSDFRFLISDVRFSSDLRFPISDIRYPTSDHWDN